VLLKLGIGHDASESALTGRENTSSPGPEARFMINTAKGVRFAGGTDFWESNEYADSCIPSTSSITLCAIGDIEEGAEGRFTVFSEKKLIEFSYVRNNVFMGLIASYKGECIRV
jgi:hypothetical protein